MQYPKNKLLLKYTTLYNNFSFVILIYLLIKKEVIDTLNLQISLYNLFNICYPGILKPVKFFIHLAYSKNYNSLTLKHRKTWTIFCPSHLFYRRAAQLLSCYFPSMFLHFYFIVILYMLTLI